MNCDERQQRMEWDEILCDLADPVRNGVGTWDEFFTAATKQGVPGDYVVEFIEFEQEYPDG